MIADILTKGLTKEKHDQFSRQMGLADSQRGSVGGYCSASGNEVAD